MKAQINNENRGKFHAQYHGQKLIMVDVNGDEYETTIGFGDGMLLPSSTKSKYIELRPLSAITDEDAIEVGLSGKQHFKQFYAAYGEVRALSILYNEIDFLRSRGYALPWMNLSVDELIAAGWVKLRKV